MERRTKSSRNSGPRPPSQRQLRMGEQLRHVLSDLFRRGELKDPFFDRADAGLTVTEVRCSPDLRNATAYIVTLGGREDPELWEALQRVTPSLQKRVGRELTSKFTPRLSFKKDKTFDEAMSINALLNRPDVRRDWDGDKNDSDAPDGGGGAHDTDD